MRILGGWMVGGALVLGVLGCNGSPTSPTTGPVVAQERHVQAPPPPVRRPFAKPRSLGSVVHAPPTTVAAPLAGAVVDARALVITTDGTDAAFAAISQTLEYLGAPFDVLNATTGPTLTADSLATGTHGRYDAIFLDLGGLETSTGSAFTTAEWTALENYEAAFDVRRVALYASPNAMYDLADNGSIDPQQTPVTLSCTAAGATVFAGSNCANPIVMTDGWVYPATVALTSSGDTVTPLLSDASGNVYGVTIQYADGRQALALTFAQAYYLTPYLELAYGLVNWATRGLFVGERHVYFVPQIDDLFLASTIYTGGTYRIDDADLQALSNWQNGMRAQPQFADLRLAWCANGQGSQSMPGDPLTAKVVALGPTFSYINHSWDHPILDELSYADVLTEFTRNDAYLKGLGLMPYATVNAVTPSISGLGSADAMLALHDAGIRQVVSDTSVAGQDNPSPNAGIPNALQPSVLEVPRIPTNLDFDVSQPAEWIPEYEATVTKGAAAVDYPTMIDQTSDELVQYMLNGENDPLMFHQANTRDYDGQGNSLLSDLLTATLNKYAALATFPIVTPTMDDLAARVQNRMTFNTSGVTATITPSTSITLTVAQAATVPVTGVCTPGAENYAGQTISYLALGAGQSVTLSLTDCNPGYGTGGTTGAGGTTGTGGATGTGGTPGMGGATATGGATGAGGTTGTGGAGGTGVIVGTGGASGTGGVTGTGNTTGSGGASGTGGAGTGGTTGEGATGGSGEPEGTGGAGESTGGVPPVTGGASGAGQDAGVAPPIAPSAGCDCSTASGPAPETSVLLIGAVGFLLGRRNRRGGRSGGGVSRGRGGAPARTRRPCCPAGAGS